MADLQETVVETTATEAKTAKGRERALQAALDRDPKVYGSTVGSLIKYSQHILKTQTELGGGIRGLKVVEWETFKTKMKGCPSDISKYCAIARNAYLIKPDYWPMLPNSLSILYELAVWMERVPPSQEQWETLIDVEGNPPFDPQDQTVAALYHDTIHPRMTRADAEKLAGKKTAAERAEEKKLRDAENQRVVEEEHFKAGMQLERSQTSAASASVAPSAPAEVPSELGSEAPVAAQRPQEQEPAAPQSASVLAPSSSIAVVVEAEEREDNHEFAIEEPSQPATEEPQLTPENILAAQDVQDAEDDSDIIVYQDFMDFYQQLQLRRLVKKFMNDNRIFYKTVEIEITITKPDQEGKAVEPATQKKQMNRAKDVTVRRRGPLAPGAGGTGRSS